METLPFTFLLKKFVAALLLPPLMPLLSIVIGLLLLRKRPRLGRSLAWSGLLVAWLLSTPVVVNLITTPLEDVPVLHPEDLARGEAIVILGAGAHRFMPEYGGAGPNRLALERLRFGARLARVSGLPILVSGEAVPMAESLWLDFGIEPRWLDAGSLDTEDNGRNTTDILRDEGIGRVVLVTHAAHMRRAMAEFSGHGVEVIPAPTAFLKSFEGDEPRVAFLDYLPGPSAAYTAWYACHEWAGLLAMKLRQMAR
ncbi:MAG: YdcF family protein [Pseudomonadota bacterium]